MRIAFAGLRHDHIFAVHDMAQRQGDYVVTGAFEADETARAKAESRGLSCHYPTYEALLADDTVEAVALGGCYGDRGQMAMDALRAGKHVLADKPLCTSLAELDEIERLANSTGKKVGCMLTMRYDPTLAAVCALVRSSALGEIGNITFGGQHPLQYGRRPMWYFAPGKHGGVINDIAIHGIDILSFAFGIHDFSVNAARCWNHFATEEPDFADCGQFMLTGEHGEGILGDVSYAVPDGIEFGLPMYWQFTVWGTGGVLDFALGKEDILFYGRGKKEPEIVFQKAPTTDYMTDFLHLCHGEDVLLPMEEVFRSTRNTLKVQTYANNL